MLPRDRLCRLRWRSLSALATAAEPAASLTEFTDTTCRAASASAATFTTCAACATTLAAAAVSTSATAISTVSLATAAVSVATAAWLRAQQDGC